ncbi:hypothetical protein FO519_007029 [Halicephalobus sp. NKZ332]|nr:hypothetical protein FO519_007029 [Halicephalobus sp. NKZ332]
MVDRTSIEEVDADYYNLDDIMATKSTIACNYSPESPSEVFRLIGQKPPETIPPKGFKTETPVWMASVLTSKTVFHVEAQTPKAFSEAMRDGLKAKPEVANLDSFCLHFYLLGRHVAKIVGGDHGKSIADCLLRVFMKRSGYIFRMSVDPSTKPMKFDSTEKKLFLLAQRSEIRTTEWFHRVDRRSLKRKHSSK